MAEIEGGDEHGGIDGRDTQDFDIPKVLELAGVPMKRLITILMLCLFISSPMFAAAQELPVEPLSQAWKLVIARDNGIYWIGEEIAGAVNGTANTSISIELRPIFNGTVQNATYQAYFRTNGNGSCTFLISRVDEPGDYRLQILVNQMVVVFQDIVFNFDPVRWNEIQHEKEKYHDWQQDNALLNKTLADKVIWNYIHKIENYFLIIIGIVTVICIAELPQWINRYAAYKKKSGKGSWTVRMLARAEDRTLVYGGAKVGDEDPKISSKEITWRPKPYMTKIDGKEMLVDIKTDIWSLSGKTTDGVLEQIKVNADKLGVKLPPKAQYIEKLSWGERRKAEKLAKRMAKWNDNLMDAIEECVERSKETEKEMD